MAKGNNGVALNQSKVSTLVLVDESESYNCITNKGGYELVDETESCFGITNKGRRIQVEEKETYHGIKQKKKERTSGRNSDMRWYGGQ